MNAEDTCRRSRLQRRQAGAKLCSEPAAAKPLAACALTLAMLPAMSAAQGEDPATLIWVLVAEAHLAAFIISLPRPEEEVEGALTSIPSWPKWMTRPEP